MLFSISHSLLLHRVLFFRETASLGLSVGRVGEAVRIVRKRPFGWETHSLVKRTKCRDTNVERLCQPTQKNVILKIDTIKFFTRIHSKNGSHNIIDENKRSKLLINFGLGSLNEPFKCISFMLLKR